MRLVRRDRSDPKLEPSALIFMPCALLLDTVETLCLVILPFGRLENRCQGGYRSRVDWRGKRLRDALSEKRWPGRGKAIPNYRAGTPHRTDSRIGYHTVPGL